MKFALLILGTLSLAIGALALFLYWYGRRLPERYRHSAKADLPAPPQRVWDAITQYDKMPLWWNGVKRVETETRSDGTVVTWSVDKHGQRVGSVTDSASEPRLLVRRFLDEGLPFGGTWTFELEPQGSGTRLTLTEDSFIRSPLFRAVASLFVGLGTTRDGFLKALGVLLTP